MPALNQGRHQSEPDRQMAAAESGTAEGRSRRRRAGRAPPMSRRRRGRPSATPFRAVFRVAPTRGRGEGSGRGRPPKPDMDDDEFENQMGRSLPLYRGRGPEAGRWSRPSTRIASEYKKLRRLQEQDIANQLQTRALSPLAGAQVQEAEGTRSSSR